MASLKALKSKITGVKSTRKITEAMKMVAASKMRRNQQAFHAAQPYAERMQAMMANILDSIADGEMDLSKFPLLGSKERDEKYLLIVVGSQKGLAGAFNINLLKHVRAEVTEMQKAGKEVKIIAVGSKLETIARVHFGDMVLEGFAIDDKGEGQLNLARDLGKKVSNMIETGEFDRCTVLSNRFVNALVQQPTTFGIVPPQEKEKVEGAVNQECDFEPSGEELLGKLLPRNLEVQIFLAVLESALGEQAARTTAMDGASRNAGKMIDDLTLRYNRTRQANITQELSEIVAGATAVGA